MEKDSPFVDRREYYRINEEAVFDYRIIDNNEAPFNDTEDTILKANQLTHELNMIDQRNATLSQEFSHQRPFLADYLNNLNRKISLLSKFITNDLLTRFLMEMNKQSLQRVNLSAGGLAFFSETPIPPNTRLSMRLVLFPDYQCIVTRGVTLNCKERKHNPVTYRISVKFVDLSDFEEQTLVRYIFQRQIVQAKHNRYKPLPQDKNNDSNSSA